MTKSMFATARGVDFLADQLLDTAKRLDALCTPSPEVAEGTSAAEHVIENTTALVGKLRHKAKEDNADARVWRNAFVALDRASDALSRAERTLGRSRDRDEREAVKQLRDSIHTWQTNAGEIASAGASMAACLDDFAAGAYATYVRMLAEKDTTILPGAQVQRWAKLVNDAGEAAAREAREIRRRAGG